MNKNLNDIFCSMSNVTNSTLLKQYITDLILQVNGSEITNIVVKDGKDFAFKNISGDHVYIYIKAGHVYVYADFKDGNRQHLYYTVSNDGSKSVLYESVKMIKQPNGYKFFEEIEDSYFYDSNDKFIKRVCNVDSSLCDSSGMISSDVVGENYSKRIEEYLVDNEIFRHVSTNYNYFPDNNSEVCSTCVYQVGIYGSENSSELVEPVYKKIENNVLKKF